MQRYHVQPTSFTPPPLIFWLCACRRHDLEVRLDPGRRLRLLRGELHRRGRARDGRRLLPGHGVAIDVAERLRAPRDRFLRRDRVGGEGSRSSAGCFSWGSARRATRYRRDARAKGAPSATTASTTNWRPKRDRRNSPDREFAPAFAPQREREGDHAHAPADPGRSCQEA